MTHFACSAPARVAKDVQPGEPTLKVMTYNVNYGVAGDQPTLAAIRNSGADIVFLQETNPAWQAQIEALTDTYPHMVFHHSPGAGGYAFLSKYAFEHETLDAHPESWFPAGYAVFDTPLGEVQGLNVHLRPPFSDSGSFVSGYFTTPKTRVAEIEHFSGGLDDTLPLIVAGDFNEDSGGSALKILEGRGLKNALAEFQPRADTWRWNTSVGTVRSQLDHVVYTTDLEPVNLQVRDQGNSDHLPIVAVFVRSK
jgi:endonuclease/exonuclease/phosphatase (EEP) superfamily protein YafD